MGFIFGNRLLCKGQTAIGVTQRKSLTGVAIYIKYLRFFFFFYLWLEGVQALLKTPIPYGHYSSAAHREQGLRSGAGTVRLDLPHARVPHRPAKKHAAIRSPAW